MRQALNLSQRDLPAVEAISQLGEGWVGEEALGSSSDCALKFRSNFKKALIFL